MAANITDVTNYSPRGTDLFFFDNNIWMFLFCPIGGFNQAKQDCYSKLLQNIRSSRSCIFISSSILSEFANSYLRMDFEQWKKETSNQHLFFKKDFIGTPRYKDTVKEIKVSITKIMAFCEKTSDNFNAIELDNLFQHFSEIDFNDSYYIELAKLARWKIVTDDKDFIKYTNHDLEIITMV